MADFVTNIPWETNVRGPNYGANTTYQLAAEWLKDCQTVADWGGGRGYLKLFLPTTVHYTIVDGTHESGWPAVTLANLAKYREPSEGILLRHVLEMTPDWALILLNAVAAFQRRMVLITFTKDVKKTQLWTHHKTWPVYRFNHREDLIPHFARYLVRSTLIHTSPPQIPERLYFLEKP